MLSSALPRCFLDDHDACNAALVIVIFASQDQLFLDLSGTAEGGSDLKKKNHVRETLTCKYGLKGPYSTFAIFGAIEIIDFGR